MNVLVAVAIVVASAALAITAILLVRRKAPDGSFFNDGDRASGFFGVLATGFAVLLGLIVVLAFTSYDNSRSGAETEASIISQQWEIAQLLPHPAGQRLGAELLCYGRSVAYQEWPQMEDGNASNSINPWSVALFRTLQTVKPRSATEQAAYAKWLALRLDRETARSTRLHGADGVIPTPLWLVLFLTAGVILGFMLLFADSGEPAPVQATQIGAVIAVIVATLLVIGFLDAPYSPGVGSLRPTAMERTLKVLDEGRHILGDSTPVPCDAKGRAV